MSVEHLPKLPVADVAQGGREDGDDAGIVGRGREHGRLGEKEIPDEDDGAGTEFGVQGRLPAPEGSPVDVVIVDQGRGMEQLHAGCSRNERFEMVLVASTCEQQNERPQSLATCSNDLADKR